MHSPLPRARFVFLPVLLAACAGFAACSGEDPAAPADAVSADAASAETGATPDPGDPDPGPVDAAADADEITEGGDLPDLDLDGDGGDDDGDGGIDAGADCSALKAGAFVDSTCASTRILHAGGDLVSESYELRNVTVLGSSAFCSDTFQVIEHAGRLVVTASSPTSARLELVEHYRKKGALRFRTVRYDVDATATGSDLALTAAPSCPGTTPPSKAKFTAGTNKAGEKYIRLALPYGASGSAHYTFVKPKLLKL